MLTALQNFIALATMMRVMARTYCKKAGCLVLIGGYDAVYERLSAAAGGRWGGGTTNLRIGRINAVDSNPAYENVTDNYRNTVETNRTIRFIRNW